MTEQLRAVFDTNVFVSAFLSRNPTSPTQELIRRWQADEFILLICDALLDEIIEKLLEKGIEQEQVIEFLALVEQLAEWVDIPTDAIEAIVVNDPDDNVIVACAVVGQADYLVSYDPHFGPLGDTYQGVKITKALSFLWAVRGDTSPQP